MYNLDSLSSSWRAAGSPQAAHANGAGPGFLAGPAFMLPPGIRYGGMGGGGGNDSKRRKRGLRTTDHAAILNGGMVGGPLGSPDLVDGEAPQGQGGNQGGNQGGDQGQMMPPRKRTQGYKSQSARPAGVGGQLSNRSSYMPARAQPPSRRWM